MSTSAEQVARLLAMVPYLRVNPGVPIAEVAKHFATTPRQVMADLRVLWMCGLPGGLPDDLIEIDMDAAEGEGVVHLGNVDYLTRPLRFTPDEAVSLVVALQAIAELATGPLKQAAETASAKLAEVTGQHEPVLLAVSTGDEELRERLVSAIRAGERVQLTYDGAARGETTTPLVDPADVQMRDSAAYLQAWSLQRRAWRTYRLDRIVEVTPTGEPAEPHGPVPDLPEGWFDASDGAVTLELSPAAAWVAEYYPVLSVEQLASGRLRVRLAVSDPAWLDSLLLRLGDQVAAIDPVDAGAGAARAAAEALRITDQFCDSLPDQEPGTDRFRGHGPGQA
ncbi:MAG: WYL domain-containing protein [Brooklawnia sp.]|uniref:helix-turn-helix transcriptional regulator n=1 Tax=Brooklawnia sp. TaxID=2699740 RepID=UPI003C77032F